MARSRTLVIPLTLLGLFLLGTVIVLSTVSYYLAIDATAYLTELEVPKSAGKVPQNSTAEQIPRIIHQTWKTDVLPDRWEAVSRTCTSIMPDYEYMLWTDAKSREFIAKEYSWFLSTFDSYTYPIQRADAIRYFVLHHFGGVYLDLDVECLRPLDPLLVYPVVLPKTIPVGVSNDLMFAAKQHPFMAQTIHNLITFDHNWVLNYPTVMFSTGPMFLSAQYGLWTASHPESPSSGVTGGEVRILSKPLYGKNAKPEEAPNAFFRHHYGSSWHADDAAFITFLGVWGRVLMKFGVFILGAGLVHMFWFRKRSRGSIRRHLTLRYDLLLPRGYSDRRGGSGTDDEESQGRVDFSMFTFASGSTSTSPSSPTSTTPPSSNPPSPTIPLSLLPLPFDLRPGSPALSSVSNSSDRTERSSAAAVTADAFRRAGTWVVSVPSYIANSRGGSSHSRHHSRVGRSSSSAGGTSGGNRSFVALLPAIFTPAPLPRRHRSSSSSTYRDTEHESGGSRRHSHHHHQHSRERSSSPPARFPSSSRRPSTLSISTAAPKEVDLIDLDAGRQPSSERPRPATPLMVIDPLEGSDVRSTRSDSISVAVAEGQSLLPPPYRSPNGPNGGSRVIGRSLSAVGLGERDLMS